MFVSPLALSLMLLVLGDTPVLLIGLSSDEIPAVLPAVGSDVNLVSNKDSVIIVDEFEKLFIIQLWSLKKG